VEGEHYNAALTFEEVDLLPKSIVIGASDWIHERRAQAGKLVADWS